MEMNIMETGGEFKAQRKADENSIRKLEKHLGKLLLILKLTGIPISESSNSSRQGYLLDYLLKLCYPIFLHLSCLYLWYATISEGGLEYATIIDVILPVLPCFMWLLLRKQKALKWFLADLSNITSKNFTSHNRFLLYCTNLALCFIFIYPLLLIALRIIVGNVMNVREVFRILQEAVFPCIMVITYVSICYVLLQNFRFYKKMFHKKLDLACSTDMKNTMKDYLNIIKNVEIFDNLFCNVTFVLLLQALCIITILVIDMMVVEDFVAMILFEALCEFIFIFVTLGIMSFCAGNISIEMAAIKSVLFEKMFYQLNQDSCINYEKHINFLLKKDACILTAGKAIAFDRGFLLKAFVFIIIEVIFICEVVFRIYPH
ncbi:hypothetical protein HNY73_007351 [Argiope bruennichi]|uniref:Uncharacterized protein n=1 Tax=Argiope bruennichi TaxID=94029 RepID=A0A8T0FGA2_ARGBR|nr:hypothetical protein HNY73_007351 [Argiope bruennichi]